MDKIIDELTRRYNKTLSKIGIEFIYNLSDYIELLLMNSVTKELIENNKLLPMTDNRNISSILDKLINEIYTPLRQNPEINNFDSFKTIDESDADQPILLFINPFAWKAIYQRYIFKNKLNIIHERIITQLKNKELLTINNKIIKKLYFDEQQSQLIIGKYNIQINRQKGITEQHRILLYIFKQEDLNEEFSYWEMAEDVTGDEYDKKYRRYFEACRAINEKVRKATENIITEFLIANTSKRGFVKINPEVIQKFG